MDKIEMKVVRGIPQYGFIHFSDITSVCNAFKEMDGYKHGSSRLKLGFGRRRPTNCVWLDSLPSDMTSETLKKHYSQFGTVVEVVLDKLKHRALVLFLDTKDAIVALRRTRYWNPGGKTLMVDFSTQNGQLFFYQSMKASGQDLGDMSDLSGDESDDSSEKAKTQSTSGAPKNSSSSTKDKTKSSKPSGITLESV
ncbi:msx2-interacting protein-like [Protopterus annectens]|uniref:msx2-interacting protein-like n=1 Tax=Protopterus annectens TaxID=7888 RepID=UPI001CFBA6C8|nr:msx2-interacting protein-like [Protopterus annectens]